MYISKLEQYLKLSFSFLILICGVEQALSAQGMDEPAGQQGHKRLRTQTIDIEVNDLVKAYPVIGNVVSGYVSLSDLCSMESVCKTFAFNIRNALQYQAIIFDPDNQGGWQRNDTKTAKDSFLSLKQSNYNFLVHFSDLWRRYFPLKMIDKLPLDMPLFYYWEKPITQGQFDTMNKAYQTIPHFCSSSFISKSPFFYKSLMGKMRTAEPINQNSRIDMYPDYVLNRQTCTDIINQTDTNCLPSTKAEAQHFLAYMDYMGKGGPINYAAARAGFNAVLNNNAASPEARANAQLRLAEMDYFGREGPVNYAGARKGFNAVLNNNASSPADRAHAQMGLAGMDYCGRGGPVNYAAAQACLNAVLNNNAASPKDRAQAQLRLAEMDRLEKAGSKPTDSPIRSAKG